MSKIWKERLDPERHIDYMKTSHIGGFSPELPRDSLIQQWVYFVAVCSFTFQFHSLQQIQECLEYFSQKNHPSSRLPDLTLEHYWQRWFERLPGELFKDSKRQRIVKALQQAVNQFSSDS